MIRKLASIQEVAEIKPIEGADSIEAIRINGWWVVAKKNEFVIGQQIVYFEVDSWIPTELAPFLSKGKEPREFEGVKGERLRTVKLRGQLSQGLVLPFCIAQEGLHLYPLRLGTDVTDLLGVKKWELPLNAQIAGQAKGNFPHFIRKTDQERVQNLPEVFDNLEVEYEVTLKLDGSSCTLYHFNGESGICSRNFELKDNEENANNAFILAAKETGVYQALISSGKNYAIQGEILSPKIQGNREQRTKPELWIFDVFDIDNQVYLDSESRFEFLNALNVPYNHVPVLHFGSLSGLSINTLEDMLNYVDRPSLIHQVAEGCVFKKLDGSDSFKCINNNFLLKEK